MPKCYERICTESVSPMLPWHATVYSRGQLCCKLRKAISIWCSFSWTIVYCCSLAFKLNSCMILLGFKMSCPESSEATVQINILAPHYSLWDQEHLIFYYSDGGPKCPFFITWMCSYNNTVLGVNVEYVHEFIDLCYFFRSDHSLCFSPVI